MAEIKKNISKSFQNDYQFNPKIIYNPPENDPDINSNSVGEFIMNKMKMFRNKIAQIDATTGESQTYDEFLQKSIRVAQHLQATNITRNDIIAICSYNIPDCYIAFIAALFLGVPVSSLDPSLSLKDFIHLLNIIKPKIIFTCIENIEIIENALKNINVNSDIIVFGTFEKYTPFSDFMVVTGKEKEFQCVSVNVQDTGIIFFSSGTTGLPKGVCFTYFGILNQIPFYKYEQKNPDEDNQQVFLYFSTLHWISAAMFSLKTITLGIARLLCKTYDESEAIKLISKYKVSHLFLSPYTKTCLVKYAKMNLPIELTFLRTIIYGGGIISEEQASLLRTMLPNTLIINAYGMSEVGLITSFQPQKDLKYIIQKPTSVGKLYQGITCKIVDPDTEEILGPNQHGEIRVKANHFMKGYYNNPLETAQALDHQGYIRTGDIGYYDEDQCFYIVDRIKEMFKFRSWHISPAELEGILLTHPDIKECAVIGLPHETDRELPTAIIVLYPNAKSTADEILSFFNDQVPNQKKLRGGIIFVESLPYTVTGKLMRRYLKQKLFL